MEKFDLSLWLQDKSRKVVTREGKDVEIIHTNSPVPHHPIVGFIDKSIYTWTIDGKLIYGKKEQDKNDLFFADEESGCEIDFTTKSEDLEKEIKRYINEEVIVTSENVVISKHHEFHNFYVENLVDVAHHFAEWQKQQMMKDAVNGIMDCDDDNEWIEITDKLIVTPSSAGNRVKIIIVKEEQE